MLSVPIPQILMFDGRGFIPRLVVTPCRKSFNVLQSRFTADWRGSRATYFEPLYWIGLWLAVV